MKTAVITGATGFLGGTLIKTLLNQGVKVYGIDYAPEKLKRFTDDKNFIPVVAGFEDFLDLPKMIHDPDIDVFYHFAWAGGFTFCPEIPITVDAKGCAGVTPESHKNALEAMKMCQINVINE